MKKLIVMEEKKVSKKSRIFQPTVLEWSRYLVLDECLRDQHRCYYKEDLLKAVNRMLERCDYTPVSMRTIEDDLKFIKSDEGFKAVLAMRQDGHKKIYTYKDPRFSIMNLPMTDRESDLLSSTIIMLSRFRGLPNYHWLDHTLKMLRVKFNVKAKTASVTMDQNINLKGLDYFFERLYDACRLRLIVKIEYLRFDKMDKEPLTRVVEPYQMREWNNRWYLIGHEKEKEPRLAMVVVPIDRIESLDVESKEDRDKREESGEKFVKPSDETINAYFEDVVGVSRLPEGKAVIVRIKAWGLTAHYIETKPIHHSQKPTDEGEMTVEGPWYKKGSIKTRYKVFEMMVIPNESLIQTLLIYGNECTVMDPEPLTGKDADDKDEKKVYEEKKLAAEQIRSKLRARAEAILKYNCESQGIAPV